MNRKDRKLVRKLRKQTKYCFLPLGSSEIGAPYLHVAVCTLPRNHKGMHMCNMNGRTFVGPMTEVERLMVV